MNSKIKRYLLRFDDDVTDKIHILRELLNIELNDFMEKTLKPDLFDIESDIRSKNHNIVIQYYDLSKIIGTYTHRINDNLTEKKNIMEIKFSLPISRVIQKICNMVHRKPESFIEDIISRNINDTVKAIKNGNYDFLATYLGKDLSNIVKLINQMYKKDI